MTTAWCRKRLPKVGDVMRCQKEMFGRERVVTAIINKGVKRPGVFGDPKKPMWPEYVSLPQMYVVLDDDTNWLLYDCCEVRVEVGE